jgi:hypothetical protein
LDEKKREFNEKLSFERDKLRKTTETQKEIAKQRKVSTTTSKK